MRRLLSVCLLTLCLSVPVFAGHILPGGYKCECGSSLDCVCDSGEEPMRATAPGQPKQDADLGAETLLVLGVLLLALRYKP